MSFCVVKVRDYGEVSFTAVLSSRLKRKSMKKWSGFIFDSGWKKK